MVAVGDNATAVYANDVQSFIRASGSATAVGTGAYASLGLTSTDLQGGSNYYTVGSTSITITQAGYYEVWGAVGFPSGATNRRGLRIAQNGTPDQVSEVLINATAAGSSGTRFGTDPIILNVAANDTIAVQGFQDTGASVTTTYQTLFIRKIS